MMIIMIMMMMMIIIMIIMMTMMIAVAEISIRGDFFFKSYHKFSEFNLFFIHPILF